MATTPKAARPKLPRAGAPFEIGADSVGALPLVLVVEVPTLPVPEANGTVEFVPMTGEDVGPEGGVLAWKSVNVGRHSQATYREGWEHLGKPCMAECTIHPRPWCSRTCSRKGKAYQ